MDENGPTLDDFKNDDTIGSYGFMTVTGVIESPIICRHIKIECNICRKETANIYIPIDPETMKDTGERGHGGVICDKCAAKIRNLIFEGDNDLR